MSEISVVIPVRDEAGAIGALIDETAAVLRTLDADSEILCVDDGSGDDSLSEMRAARRRGAPLRILRHSSPQGQSAALLSGVLAARGRWVATLDGDGQNDPADLPALWAQASQASQAARAAPNGPPVLFAGWRRDRRDRARRRLASRIANAVRGRLLGDGAPDSACGLKLFPRALFLALPRFDHMHRFLPALALAAGAEVRSVPVRHRPRRAGASKYDNWGRLKVGAVDLLGVSWLKRRALAPDAAEDSADPKETPAGRGCDTI